MRYSQTVDDVNDAIDQEQKCTTKPYDANPIVSSA